MKKIYLLALCLALLLTAGCGGQMFSPASGDLSAAVTERPEPSQTDPIPDSTPEPTPEPTPDPTPEPTPELEPRVVALDAGHQSKANREQEPVGPGASQTKAKVSSGTQGRFTGVPEYQVNLDVTLQLRDELERRGYVVILTRETNDVNISNAERAAIANEAQVGAFVRIHCDGSEDPSVHGAFTICPTAANPYPVGGIYEECRLLADQVLDGLVEATGAQKRNVWETDTMSGLNWCEVPSIIVEMGYMTNREEDNALVSPEYQAKLVQGMANGIDNFFALLELE